MNPALPRLITERTVLRLATPDDVPEIVQYYILNREHLALFEPSRPSNFYTAGFWQVEVRDRVLDFRAKKSLKLFIFDRSSDRPPVILGSINFSNIIQGAFQACNLGYSLGAVHQGQGYMTEALAKVIPHVFAELNLHRIMAGYLPHNRRSGKLLKRLGFVPEGYARDYLLINGQWEDHVLTSLTNQNWKAVED